MMIRRRHQRYFLSGYSVPALMWWLFWPMGVPEFMEIATPMRDEVTGDFIKVRYPNPALANMKIERRFQITNREEWMARLLEAKAVRVA